MGIAAAGGQDQFFMIGLGPVDESLYEGSFSGAGFSSDKANLTFTV